MLLSFKNETRESPDLWGNKVCTNHRIFVLSLIFGLKLVNIWVLAGQDNVKPHCHTHIWKPWAFLTLTRWCPFDLQLPQSLNLLICAHLEIAQSGKKGCSHKLYCDPETRWQSIHALSRGIQSVRHFMNMPKTKVTVTAKKHTHTNPWHIFLPLLSYQL